MPANQREVSMKTLMAKFDISAPDIIVNDLVLDSREVAIHKVFVAIKGHQLDGRDFIPQAISLGAKVILTECEQPDTHGHLEMRENSVLINVFELGKKLGDIAAEFYGHPSNQLDIIAVTGTNGKTSTVQLATRLRYALGDACASIGTLGAGMCQPDTHELDATANTTPDAINMQRMLADFVDRGAKQVAMEASSHALVQHRMKSVMTKVAVFTNLSRDHLDYHGSMAEYAKAKRLLLNQPGLEFAVINADDRESQAWLNALPENVTPILTSIQGHPEPDQSTVTNAKVCYAESIVFSTSGCSLSLVSSWGDAEVHLPLLGHFNVANYLSAFASLLALGLEFDALVEATGEVKPVPGRMEIFSNQNGANIVVDYAHTPDALEQALKAAREHCQGQLISVFGCGGDRDKGKRSLMGEVAERHADKVILTSDNNRSEAPEDIMRDILSGCTQPDAIHCEVDRKQAIRFALSKTTDTDLIVVAGKGHEDYQITGGQTQPYNERLYVANLLEGKGQ